ncbi:hypothetical protein PS15p_210141 [Mucor circinelloides]
MGNNDNSSSKDIHDEEEQSEQKLQLHVFLSARKFPINFGGIQAILRQQNEFMLTQNATSKEICSKVCRNKIVSPLQSGFVPGRFICENGMILHNTKLIAIHLSSDTIIALLLDQEKAYDRVYLEYLLAVMHKFNLPIKIIHSLLTLLFSTQTNINIINGHISNSFIT